MFLSAVVKYGDLVWRVACSEKYCKKYWLEWYFATLWCG